ncbi:MAG: prolyl oligopeptidase family serine peptidase [Mucinivorans sp.]
MKNLLIPTISAMAIVSVSCGGPQKSQIKVDSYPVARQDATMDDYFTHKIADPYRWMEDDMSSETAAWVKAENTVTENYLVQIPFRQAIKNRLTELYDYEKIGTPEKHGDYYFFYKNDGLQNQSVLYYQKGLQATPNVFLDPNTMSDSGTAALVDVSFSNDSKYCAYAVAQSGSDWVVIHVKEVATCRELPDQIKWVKFSGASWGSNGFYYSRYDEPKGSALSELNEGQKVYFHKLGQEQSSDQLIYQDTVHRLRDFTAIESQDGKWLFVSGSEGTSGTELLFKSTRYKGDFRTLFAGFNNDYFLVDVQDDQALILTNDGAPNFKLIEVDLGSASLMAKDVVPESENLLQWATTAGGSIIVGHLSNASSLVSQYAMDGTLTRKIELPGIGTAAGFSGEKEDTTVFYGFSSFNVPLASYKYSIADGHSELYRATKVNFDVSQFTVEQVFYPSKDGTKVPMFLVYKKGLTRDGSAPTLLYAYGGFNISLTPSFSPANILLMEQGGVYALANIRGGGEFGEKWHKAGMFENKQNVFDDFIAAGEYLIREKYTSSEKLAISGGSNGGLLVGACLVQRPDLFAVTFPQVGVLDMLRYHKFTIGWGWVVEYGSSDVESQYDYLIKYSPLHNIKKGVDYPSTMIMTADHDDRVVPAHSFKFGATLQAAQSASGFTNPILLRIDSNAGHGAGKPISKVIDAQADMWSFMLWNTNSQYKQNTELK